MPESDVTKMKVADLKRELKLRGLSTTGNKNELQDRLQTALIDGELSLEDTAISGEDLLDGDDAVLTDEEEAKILGADENELLKSPIATPTTLPDLTLSPNINSELEDAATATVTKKIILKRKSSLTTFGSLLTSSNEPIETSVSNIAKENTEHPVPKATKMSDRNPITIAVSSDRQDNTTSKVSQLSLEERLEMRAKKFGLKTLSGTASKITASGNESIVADSKPVATADNQIEMLKKRAERFGCVVSSKIAKLDAEEKLQKRKQRFGGSSENDTTEKKLVINDVWAEKARQRLERFKTSSTPTAPATTSTAEI